MYRKNEKEQGRQITRAAAHGRAPDRAATVPAPTFRQITMSFDAAQVIAYIACVMMHPITSGSRDD